MTLKDLVRQMCEKESWKSNPTTEGWSMDVPQEKGRHQAVVATAFKDGSEEMVRYTSVVGEASALDGTRTRAALELNAKMPHGCLAVEGGSLVLTATRPLKTTTPETSAQAVRYLAHQADKYERLIYGTDSH